MTAGRTVGVCVVVFALLAAGVAGTASAQSAPTPIDSCRTIADDGEYVLTADIANSSQSTCVQILSSDVTFDGGGHTIGGANANGSVGVKVNNSLTSLSNVTVRNVSTTGWTTGVQYLDVANGSIEDVDASGNDRHGIRLRAASDARVENVTATDNDRWSLYAVGNTTVTGTGFATGSTDNASFTASDVALTGVGSPPGGLDNRSTVGQRLGAVATSDNSSLRLGIGYDEANVTRANVTENSLRMWRFEGNWSQPDGVNFVNIEQDRVVAEAEDIDNASVLAPVGDVQTPTPTPTPTATATEAAANTTSSSNGPGFGIGLALVAVLASAFVLLRRNQ
ncbi:PGF-CTERM sorting domain-containing protein [Halococcus thailandensis]|uniref:Periplasmic copper-binding protein n=1 Tax=Halococcus thailandensis JCM 13552 TaxID=1227457 RepID=M0N0Y5_9EURY|nr:PGF-CTERM sorting domain-containing protein [Halococcus thailandensis]EMA51491.1 periplasmic copper-binding protein [Halococcus thailandensis JCM 13552]